MIEPVAVKDYILPKTFGILVYVCSIIHILCGLVFTGVIIDLKNREAEEFTCYAALEYKTQVNKVCFSGYQQHYNAPLRFYIFVLLSTWFPIIVAVVYSLWVRRRVEQVDSTVNETQGDGEINNQLQSKTFNVFRLYFIHLTIRVLCGVLFTILQHALLFPRGFDSQFRCSPPPTELPTKIPKNTSISQLNNAAFIACENASDKHTMWVIISVFNAVFAFITFVEIILLCRRFPICKYITSTECDVKFIKVYLLRKEYTRIETKLASVCSHLEQSIDYYKRQVWLSLRSSGLNLGTKSKADFDELYINLLIHTERAPHKFSQHMDRHEIYDVYMKVPRDSICLEDIKDLFYPHKDTKWEFPRNILVVGRPGIGKTVLTEKIMREWCDGVDEFYHDKIAFYLKFRWFNSKNMKDMTLKTFLRNGTQLSDEKFEKIYEEITKYPRKIILIFDGLDEFKSDSDCLNDLPPPNDPDFPMSPISLFSKLIHGHFLCEATVLATSRPTAHKFYSKFNFDRTVEIIGFTEGRIEEYVTKFCHSHGRDDLKPKIWNHIKSFPDLLNSCYIPVNCWIVVTILFESVQGDPTNEMECLPTKLTELYQAAITHLDENHFRKVATYSSTEAKKELQLLAFKGIEPMQLIFDSKSFDKQMKQSGLLNSLSNPHSHAQTQFCFIHLTIQEFLAARHVIEMFSPEEIKKFIFCHIKSGKWHLVLQFIAGLLGREIKMFQKDRYKDCVLAMAKNFELTSEDDVFDITWNYTSLLVMKCLREVENEEIVKEACKATAINDIVGIRYGTGPVISLTLSDWSAVFFVCKHMKNLKKLDLFGADLGQESYLEALQLLKQRCLKELSLDRPGSGSAGNIFRALMESKCSLNHEHSKLVKLDISRHDVTHEILLTMCEFFRNGHAICLKELRLNDCGITSRELSILCEVLDSKLCPELACIGLEGNDNIADEGLTKLCHALSKQKLLKLTKLDLWWCSLTNECVPALCELLKNECCNLIDLSLKDNSGIKDEGLRILCEDALTNEHCKLERLDLKDCSLTDDCLPELCNALQDERCKLICLSLSQNKIADKGLHMLCELALTKKHCKLLELNLDGCSLTDECIPDLSNALEDEHCKLTCLSLSQNKIADKGVHVLCEFALTKEHCKLVELNLRDCSLTDECLPDLCNALEVEHCKLTCLSLSGNKITDKGLHTLCELALTKENCELVELNLQSCSLTDECIPDLHKTLHGEHCRLNKLKLFANKFTEEGQKSIYEIATYEQCKARGLEILIW